MPSRLPPIVIFCALRAAVGHPDQVLAPGLGPARGTADAPGHPAHHRVLRVGAELGAERAAHVRGDDPQACRVDPEHVRQGVARALRALVRDPRRQPTVLAPGGGRRAGSIGAGATRWLTMVRVTTTSQPSNRSALSAAASPKEAATLVPHAGNSSAVLTVGVGLGQRRSPAAAGRSRRRPVPRRPRPGTGPR